jgi:hypothetical protein
MKGDAQWAFNQFRERFLPAFISDLKALEAAGFKDPKISCPRVGRCLDEVADVLKSIPNVRPPAPTAAAEFKEFAELYLEWNNKDGDSPETREERARAHESLARKRDRFATRVGKSLPKLQGHVEWKTMDSIFEKLDSMVKDKSLDGVFNNLGKTLDKFNRNAQKFRTGS